MFFFKLPDVRLLPITSDVAPSLNACLGVITLFWSPLLSPANLIPGVIISFLNTFLTIFISWGLHTTASNLAFDARIAWRCTNSLTPLLNPISLKDFLSNEVSMVTPINFVEPDTFLAALIVRTRTNMNSYIV